ncbi:hypothetical protein MVI01_01010 [Myxococcus virescens]|uniref:Uncharacterized protein n=1 Tax=Myxococcus virescens TaxID=83456 RepID=A0A511H474_9BACT|nr:hypothetical protein MVI01_01010 [Myxococcus virescens]
MELPECMRTCLEAADTSAAQPQPTEFRGQEVAVGHGNRTRQGRLSAPLTGFEGESGLMEPQRENVPI